jgi:hypothetical protein
VSQGKGKAKQSSKGKPSVKPKRTASQKASKAWKFKAGDEIPGILDESPNPYTPTGIHKEFLDFAKVFRAVEKKIIP